MSEHSDWADDELEEREYPESDDYDHDDDPETVACPHCERQVYEDAERCPYCGEWIEHSTHPFAQKPWWWIVLGAAGIMAMLGTMLMIF